jgi:hypothetical protein
MSSTSTFRVIALREDHSPLRRVVPQREQTRAGTRIRSPDAMWSDEGFRGEALVPSPHSGRADPVELGRPPGEARTGKQS